jgi:hypothetical protein
MPRHVPRAATTAHFSDYDSLSIHTQCAWASGGLIPGTTQVNHKKRFLIAQMAQQVSVANKLVLVATQNQAECKQAARKQASARERTSTTVCRSFSSTTERFLLLLLLLPHQNVSEIQSKQVSSLVIRSLTLLLSLSPPASTTAPCPQETLRLSLRPHPLCSSAALCFCGSGLVQSIL